MSCSTWSAHSSSSLITPLCPCSAVAPPQEQSFRKSWLSKGCREHLLLTLVFPSLLLTHCFLLLSPLMFPTPSLNIPEALPSPAEGFSHARWLRHWNQPCLAQQSWPVLSKEPCSPCQHLDTNPKQMFTSK